MGFAKKRVKNALSWLYPDLQRPRAQACEDGTLSMMPGILIPQLKVEI
jgi:hypothetical protein